MKIMKSCNVKEEFWSCFTDYGSKIFITDSKNYRLSYLEELEAISNMIQELQNIGIESKMNVVLLFEKNSWMYVTLLLTLWKMDVTCTIASHLSQIEEHDAQWILSDHILENRNGKLQYVKNGIYFYKISNGRSAPYEFQNAWLVLATSGTTNKSKWVYLTGEALLSTTYAIKDYLQTKERDVFYALKYLGHISSITTDFLLSIISGGVLVINTEAFNLPSIVGQIVKEHVSVLTLVPSLLEYMINDRYYAKLSGIKKISLVGGPTKKQLIDEVKKKLPETQIYIGYGLTEASSRLTYLPPSLVYNKPNSIGKAIKSVEINLIDSLGKKINAPNTVGEIVAKSPGIMIGYRIDGRFIKHIDECLHTNDLAYFDEEGDLFHYGRKDEVLVVNGINISPILIEEEIMKLEYVRDCVVCKELESKIGDKLMALVVLHEDFPLTVHDMRATLRKVLPSTYIPKRIIKVREIPKTERGKVSRKKIAENFR